MKIAIMQPTYLAWQGYFAMIGSVDKFVFLDDVQFERRSWQVRNKILLNNTEHLITVSVNKTDRSSLISQITLNDEQNWRKKHIKTLSTAYKKAPYTEETLDIISSIITDKSINKLVSLNTSLIMKISYLLGLDCEFEFASSLNVGGHKSQHLLNICNSLDASIYLSADGSRSYIEEEGHFANSEVAIQYHNFQSRPYKQFGSKKFVSHLSILDLLFNLGINGTKSYLCQKRV